MPAVRYEPIYYVAFYGWSTPLTRRSRAIRSFRVLYAESMGGSFVVSVALRVFAGRQQLTSSG